MEVEHTSRSAKRRRIVLTRSEKQTTSTENKRRFIRSKKTKQEKANTPKSSLAILLYSAIFLVFCALLSIALLFTYRYLTTSSYFSLKYVEIQGNTRLNSREILDFIGLSEGGNVLDFSIQDIEKRLRSNPWLASVSVKRILPDRLVLELQEKKPVFMRLFQGVMYYTDISANLIAPITTENFEALPVLEIEAGAEQNVMYIPEVLRSLQDLGEYFPGSQLHRILLGAGQNVVYYFDNQDIRLLVGFEDWSANLLRLTRTLEDLQRRKELDGIKKIEADGTNVWVEKRKS